MLERRMFLRGLGGVALAIPFLPSMARAASSTPVRYVQLVSRFGQWPENWYPAQEASEQIAAHVYRSALTAISGPISTVLAPFQGLHHKLTLIRGLDGMTNGIDHSWAMPTCATALDGRFAYSIDAVLEESTAVYPVAPKLRAFRVSPVQRGGYSEYGWSWRTVGNDKIRIPHVYQSDIAFTALFGSGNVDSTAVDRQRLRSSRMTELVLGDYRRVMTSPRLSSVDKQRLDNYVSLVDDLQKRLAGSNVSCTTPSLRDEIDDIVSHENFSDMVVLALACDQTRVVSYALDWRDFDLHASGHDHAEPNAEQNIWFAERVASLMRKMDGIVEANGATLLDNSIVYWGNCQASGSHDVTGMPVLVGGSAQGMLRVGEYIDYRRRPFLYLKNRDRTRDGMVGRMYNDLLITFFRAMGLAPEDWRRLGQTSGFGDYTPIKTYWTGQRDEPIPTNEFYQEHLDGDRNAALPYYFLG